MSASRAVGRTSREAADYWFTAPGALDGFVDETAEDHTSGLARAIHDSEERGVHFVGANSDKAP